jgi:uncharacterized membrane protein
VSTSRMRVLAVAVFALMGVVFSAVSTYDFVAHLDRQVHSVTCSVVPGIGAADSTGTSGCHAALMSPYSAVLRSVTWGGVPIALASLAVFAFILFRALELFLSGASNNDDEARFLVAATVLPVLTSLVYFLISVLKVGAICTLCVMIYLASIGVFVSAILLYRAARAATLKEVPAPLPWPRYFGYFAEGVAFVLVPVVLYLALKPAYADTFGSCGQLRQRDEQSEVRIRLSGTLGGVPAIEVLDPLCPACKNFSLRLATSGLEHRLAHDIVLFPLDKECNWMVNESLHPGACAVSEAMLCAGVQAQEVLAWAFDNQSELLALGGDQGRINERVRQRFPQLADCLGKPKVRALLNRSLRWAVANKLAVQTPQLFVNGNKVCEEDTDLGLEFVLARILDKAPDAAQQRTAR